MKNIFKKNQIIITALAIMIAIAGYLNFSEKNTEDMVADLSALDVIDYDTYVETAGDDITDGDYVSLEETGLLSVTEGLLEDSSANIETAMDSEEVAATEEDMEVTDISDEDITTDVVANGDVEQYEVADTGEVVVEDGADTTAVGETTESEDIEETSAPGEAILVSTTIEPNFFANAKLLREQKRSLRKEELMDIVNNEKISDKLKEDAITSLINLASLVEKEDATETLLKAKGFDDAVVSINPDGDNVDVIVNAASITEQDVAKISDIVERKTGISLSKIVISPVVAED